MADDTYRAIAQIKAALDEPFGPIKCAETELRFLLARLDAQAAEIEQARRTADFWKAEHLASNAEIERLRSALRDCDAVARARGDKYGLCDQIDNSGSPYQSQWLADLMRTGDAARGKE